MKRFIEAELRKWAKSKRRKPLIVKGARQVGKTYIIKKFGEEYFDNLVMLDLERHPQWHNIFEGELNPKQICSDLELVLNNKIIPGKSLLFIDEIQAFPKALTALRYFYEEMPDLHVIAAGSLIEFVLNKISFPVGRIQFLKLNPLGFVEFLHANGHEKAVQKLLAPPQKLSDTIHGFILRQLREYFFVGGMPECVLTYRDSGSFKKAFEVQSEIITSYRMDFAKYSPSVDNKCLNIVLTSLAQNVGNQIKYLKLAEGFSNPTIKKAYNLLVLANLSHNIPSVSPTGIPLGASASGKKFKSIIVDIGLMHNLCEMNTSREYSLPDLLNIYRGAMAEQFIGQEIALSQHDRIFYWSRQAKSSTAEVDYVIVVNNKIIPIEVKSGSAGRLRSMHMFLDNFKNCPEGFVFSSRPYEILSGQKLTFIPLYYCFSATKSKNGFKL